MFVSTFSMKMMLATDPFFAQNVMSALNKAHSVSADQANVLPVVQILEYVLMCRQR